MRYFVVATSFAAPFVSDVSFEFVFGDSPEKALSHFAAKYSHPCKLFAAVLYQSADAYHSKEKPLAKWLATKGIQDKYPDGSLIPV